MNVLRVYVHTQETKGILKENIKPQASRIDQISHVYLITSNISEKSINTYKITVSVVNSHIQINFAINFTKLKSQN